MGEVVWFWHVIIMVGGSVKAICDIYEENAMYNITFEAYDFEEVKKRYADEL